jgi:ParB family chromosome partitioning protein
MEDNLNNKNRRLGAGLSTLLGGNGKKSYNNQQGENLDQIENIAISAIISGIYQPRKNFDQQELEELSNSIRENGLMQPITIRKAEDGKHFEIIAGERRYRACKILGMDFIPAIVKKINNHQALELAIIENIQRSDLSLIEEANGYQQLIQEFSYTQEQISKKLGKSRSHVANILRLLSLPQMAVELLDKKIISMGHARAILTASNQDELLRKIVDDTMTVREVEEEVRNQKIIKENNIKKINDEANVSNNIAMFCNEKSIKFISNQYLEDLSQEIIKFSGLSTKIVYNNNNHKGKVEIKFDNIENLKDFVMKLKIIDDIS